MPPGPPGPPPADCFSSSLISETSASVVSMRPAIDEALSSACLVTLAGSMMPASRTLMMYEHLGLVVPKRTSTNRRRFSQRDIRKLQAIQTLTRQHGVNLNGARYVLRLLRMLVDNGLQPPTELRDLDVKELDV